MQRAGRLYGGGLDAGGVAGIDRRLLREDRG
jgi:hypothetical protein